MQPKRKYTMKHPPGWLHSECKKGRHKWIAPIKQGSRCGRPNCSALRRSAIPPEVYRARLRGLNKPPAPAPAPAAAPGPAPAAAAPAPAPAPAPAAPARPKFGDIAATLRMQSEAIEIGPSPVPSHPTDGGPSLEASPAGGAATPAEPKSDRTSLTELVLPELPGLMVTGCEHAVRWCGREPGEPDEEYLERWRREFDTTIGQKLPKLEMNPVLALVVLTILLAVSMWASGTPIAKKEKPRREAIAPVPTPAPPQQAPAPAPATMPGSVLPFTAPHDVEPDEVTDATS